MAIKKLTMCELHYLLDKVKEVQDAGHFASISFGNHGLDVSVCFERNGFKVDSEYDYIADFNLSSEEEDLQCYQETLDFFKGILGQPVKEMTLKEIEKQLGYKVKIVGEK